MPTLITILIIAIAFSIFYFCRNFILNDNAAPEEKKLNEPLPYKQKNLLTKTEYEFANYLLYACSKYQIRVCPKVRMEDFIEVTTKNNRMKYRGHIKSRHIDFLLSDKQFHLLCAIELDDKSHYKKAVRKADNLKNEIYKTIDLKLFRVNVNSDWKKEIVEIIKYCYPFIKPETNT